jgi:hypothetical protein
MVVSFFTPILLYGLAFAALPIIIHLLFRRRFRRIEWAPFEYLKLSLKRNRKRIRLEQLLLLALRVLIVLVLFFTVARPVLQAAGLAGWLGGRSRTSQILIIDDSLSMGFKDEGQPALERARQLAVEILKTIGSQDRFTLILSSSPKSPVLREVEFADRQQIAELIGRLPPSDTYTAWDATLAAVDELIASATYPIREVTLITDLRRAGWGSRVGDVPGRWAAQRVRLRIFDVGCDRIGNVALLGLEQTDRVALVGTATRYEAVVHNNRTAEAEGLETTFTVDAKPSLVRLPPIAAGATARVPLLATFQEPGTHHVSFRLHADDLEADNERWVVTPVREQLHLVLVDGEPSNEPLGGEVDFLSLALSVGVEEGEAWQVDVVTDSEWASMPLARPDLLVLASVPSLQRERARELERLVESGTGLMIFVGDQVDPDNYNQLLYRDGTGLLPGRLEVAAEDEVTGLVLEDVERSPLEALAQLNPAVLERIRLRKLMRVQLPPDETHGSRVLARWNNPGSSPAALAKEFGRGHVLVWTVTADKAWSDWPTEPSYVLGMREAAKAIARADPLPRTLTAGELLRRPLAAGQQAASPVVEPPGADAPVPLTIEQDGESDPNASDAPKALAFDDTGRAGLYKLSWRDSAGSTQHDIFAVNPDRRESDLARIAPAELRSLFGSLEPDVISAGSGSATPIALRGQEIWRTLAAALLCLLAVEACFATWAGRQR